MKQLKHIARWAMVLLLLPLIGKANEEGNIRVIPKLEQSSILIGEQVKLNVRVVYPRTEAMRLILPEDTLVTDVEILESKLVDSLIINDQLQEMIYDVVITSFDSANYQLRNINALVGDSLYTATEAPNLIVNTVPVDINQPDKYADIKGQWRPKMVWQDYLPILYIVIGAILLCLALYLIVRYIKRHKQRKVPQAEEVILLDPYQEAIQGIESLRGEELWKQNRAKEYYTELTDILRRYLYRVYGMNTLDRTSSEILESFKQEIGRDRMYNELSRILKTADLAKFAKYQSDNDESISLLSASVAFIEEHKPKEDEPKEDEKGGETL